MKILSMDIENFGPIAAAVLKLDDRGLVNIEGVNKDDPSADSNGSGKSTIPDALYWGMFGETARGVAGDDVIATFAGKQCMVKVRIAEGDETYFIKRWRKYKGQGKASGLSLELIDAAGTLTDLSLGTDKLTQAKIETILGCSQEVFTKAVYSGQEALPDLPRMTDKQIKELVEEAAGIEVLTRAYDLAKAHKRDTDRAESDTNRDLQEAERSHNDAVVMSNNMVKNRDGWQALQDIKIAGAKAGVIALAKTAKDFAEARDKIDVAALTTAITSSRARVDAVAGEQVTLRDHARTVSATRTAKAGSASTLTAKLAEVKRAQTHLASIDTKTGSPCGECGKAYAPEDLAGARKLATDKQEALVAEGRTLQAAYQTCVDAEATALKVHDDYQAGMTDLTSTLAEIRVAETQIAEHGRLNREFERGRQNAHNANERLKEIAAETNPFIDPANDGAIMVADRLAVLGSRKALFNDAQVAGIIAADAVAAFGPTGVRAYVLDTVTPYLNSRTAHYLGTLSDGRIEAIWTTLATNSKGELVEKFCIEVQKIGGGQTFKALSGGEKRKVRLSCAFALQDLISSRATKPINLWIGDEIDDALDESGLERLMTLLEEKGREKGTVLVISHNSLSDYIRETLTVTMEAGRSTISGSIAA